jgi:type I restriction enzyme S subunit
MLAPLPIQLPPLEEQRRIAEVLRSVDEAIAYNESAAWVARKLVRQLASDVAARATDSAPIGSLWDVVTGRTPAPDNRELWDGDLPFVTPGDINDQDVSVRSSARSLNALAAHGGRIVPAGSLLVTCIGSTVGKMGVSHVEVSTNQQINAVLCPPELSGYAYVACLSILDEILANAGRQAVPIINKTTFSSLEIPLLSSVEMNEINKTVLALDEEIIAARQATYQLRQLKTCVCSDLLSGRVRVPA